MEATAQKEYEEFMTDSAADKAAKAADIEPKAAKMQDQEQALASRALSRGAGVRCVAALPPT